MRVLTLGVMVGLGWVVGLTGTGSLAARAQGAAGAVADEPVVAVETFTCDPEVEACIEVILPEPLPEGVEAVAVRGDIESNRYELCPPGGWVEIRYRSNRVRARCAEVVLAEAAERVVLEGEVRVERPDAVATGERLEAELGAERFVLVGSVHLVQRAEGSGETLRTVEADRVVYQGSTGDVEAQGSVRVSDERVDGRGDWLRYDAGARRVTLRGNPARVQADGERPVNLVGVELRYDTASGQVLVVGPTRLRVPVTRGEGDGGGGG